MKAEKTLLILWIIFGFVFVQAIDSILYLTIHLIYFGTVYLGVGFSILKFLIPAITLLIYLLAIFLIQGRISIKSGISGLLPTQFPKNQFFALLILAVVLSPITNKLSGLFAVSMHSILTLDELEFIEFYGWFHMGIGIARWTSVTALALIYLRKNRQLK